MDTLLDISRFGFIDRPGKGAFSPSPGSAGWRFLAAESSTVRRTYHSGEGFILIVASIPGSEMVMVQVYKDTGI